MVDFTALDFAALAKTLGLEIGSSVQRTYHVANYLAAKGWKKKEILRTIEIFEDLGYMKWIQSQHPNQLSKDWYIIEAIKDANLNRVAIN